MSASSLSLLIATLPLAFAAPYQRPDLWEGCGQADRPCSRPPTKPEPSWSRGPYQPCNSSGSSGVAMPTGTGHGTAPWGTGTGYPIYPTGTAPYGSGVMSILPIESSSSTLLYTNPIRSSTSTPVDEPIVTTSPASTWTSTTPIPATTPLDASRSAEIDDPVKSQFATSTTWTFEPSGALPTDLWAATDFIGSEPLTHTFAKKNVFIDEEGFLVLNVPGGQAGQSDISSAEVSTTFDMKHGSVRTWAVLTEEPGVCNGIFFYESDAQETDIEWISDPAAQSNAYANNGTRALQYTNQDTAGVFADKTSVFGRAPEDATSAVHEYRLDWFGDRTEFFLDGVFQFRLDTDVPTASGPWVWNNWANGDPAWTADPPKQDAPFKIKKIEMYYDPA